MSSTEILDFDEFVDLLRERLFDSEALDSSTLPDFQDLMVDHADVVPDVWYQQAYDELEAQGHLNPRLSGGTMGGRLYARLSADGRLYVRQSRD